jgi:hypothetical protein
MRLTCNALDAMNVPYNVVVEPDEKPLYSADLGGKVLAVPQKYHDEFDPCMTLNPGQSQGSGPARNFCWEDSIKRGFKRHWVVDDNIRYFYKLNNNLKTKVSDGEIFARMEAFTERYKNVALSGPHYGNFAHRKMALPPFIINTRLFSCILINNELPFRWRARYNEDVDLSLRCLKAGYPTIQFYAYLQEKQATLTMKGGNTDTIYVGGTLQKSKMIVMLHPDVARLTWKFNRWHHEIDYSGFKGNKLIPVKDVG